MSIPKPLAYICFVIPYLAVIGSFGFLALHRFPPNGILRIETRMDGNSPWIFPFLPAERTTKPGVQEGGWIGQRITNDPVYFGVRVPGPYESVDVSVEFRPNNQPLVEFGVVHDAAGKELELHPLYSTELDRVDWSPATTPSSQGFFRNGSSASDLDSTDPSRLALWHASGSLPLLADPIATSSTTRISLRGSHDFWVVPAGGELRFSVTYQDANRKEGTDAVAFRVFRGDAELSDLAYAQAATRDSKMGTLQTHEVRISSAQPGVYRISFIAQDDVFIRQIETSSKRWVLGPRVYLADTVGVAWDAPTPDIWTDSRHVVAETFHPEGLQTLTFGSASVRIPKTHTTVRLDRADDPSSIALLRAPKGDVRFILDGYAAFTKDAFFKPMPRRLTDATQLLPDGITAVRTPYARPVPTADGWLSSTFRFSVNPNLDTLRFVLAAPGIASRTGSVDVRRVMLTFHRPAESAGAWIRALRQELRNAWRRLHL